MAGLMDFFQTPAGQGLLAAGFSAAANAGRGGPVNTLGRAGLGGLLAYTGAQDNQLRQADEAQQREVRAMQMKKMQADLADEELARTTASQYFTPETPGAGSAPLPAKPAAFNMEGYAQARMAQNPIAGMKLMESLKKDDTPLTVAPGASVLDRRTMKPIFTAPDKPEGTPAAVREYEYAQGQGYKGTFEQWDMARKKAGGTNVNLAVNSEKNMLNGVADGIGKSITAAQDGARSALGTISTVNRLNDALDSGKVMAGPGTAFRQYGLQVGSMLGVGGKDGQEKLLNTRQAIQSLAQLELDAAQQMKGQGQITDAERNIIKRAASGDIDGMTTNELRLLGGVLDRSARNKIRNYNTQVKPLASNPNAAPLAPFLNIEEPPERKAAGGVRRYNPATGRIE